MLKLSGKIYSVSEINGMIKAILQQEYLLQYIQVQGEISNYKRYASGHAYFTIKDSNSNLKAVMFNSRVQKLNFQPENGMQVLILGSITVYERDGVYQLGAERMLPAGQGDMQLLFEKLKSKFETEGLFDVRYKKKLPLLPKAIGVITSPNGAAIRDIIKVAKSRHPGVKIYLAPVRVQGLQSEQEINQAIELLNRLPEIETIILGRGGGSKEDLWVFNSESIVRRIFMSTKPIISAVGHEIDVTLADYAADIRAATPSQAAELAVPVYLDLHEKLNRLNKLAGQLQRHKLERAGLNLAKYKNSYILRNPSRILEKYIYRLTEVQKNLKQVNKEQLKEKKEKLHKLILLLQANNPLRIMEKGFASVSFKEKPLKSIKQITIENELKIRLVDGVICAKVLEIKDKQEKY